LVPIQLALRDRSGGLGERVGLVDVADTLVTVAAEVPVVTALVVAAVVAVARIGDGVGSAPGAPTPHP
jgi:hypothetical protein